jgi:hypothetical protein
MKDAVVTRGGTDIADVNRERGGKYDSNWLGEPELELAPEPELELGRKDDIDWAGDDELEIELGVEGVSGGDGDWCREGNGVAGRELTGDGLEGEDIYIYLCCRMNRDQRFYKQGKIEGYG